MDNEAKWEKIDNAVFAASERGWSVEYIYNAVHKALEGNPPKSEEVIQKSTHNTTHEEIKPCSNKECKSFCSNLVNRCIQHFCDELDKLSNCSDYRA